MGKGKQKIQSQQSADFFAMRGMALPLRECFLMKKAVCAI